MSISFCWYIFCILNRLWVILIFVITWQGVKYGNNNNYTNIHFYVVGTKSNILYELSCIDAPNLCLIGGNNINLLLIDTYKINIDNDHCYYPLGTFSLEKTGEQISWQQYRISKSQEYQSLAYWIYQRLKFLAFWDSILSARNLIPELGNWRIRLGGI